MEEFFVVTAKKESFIFTLTEKGDVSQKHSMIKIK